MTETTPPASNPASTDDISLENIDALLDSEDPEFSKQLKDVAAIAPDANIVIESSTEVADVVVGEKIEGPPVGIKGRVLFWLKNTLVTSRGRLLALLSALGRESLIFLKTRPKEFALFTWATIKILAKSIWIPIKAFQESSGTRKLAIISFGLLIVVGAWVTIANLKGVWIPQLSEPILENLEKHATGITSFDPLEEGESFYSAFPQERHEYLFPKLKVNLARSAEHPNPMGAFEIIFLLDSKDTAIEVGDRKIEFFDLIQRVLEDENYDSLATELGKAKVKSNLKRELNQKLTQGWVKDISFRTFILKP